MKNLLAAWPSGTIVLGYGLNESFAGKEGLSDFSAQYAAHLRQLAGVHPGANVVMLSPIAIEGASGERQAEVLQYRDEIAAIAEAHGRSLSICLRPCSRRIRSRMHR